MGIESGFVNLAFIDEQHERYLQNPKDVDSSWQNFFRSLEALPVESTDNTSAAEILPIGKETVSQASKETYKPSTDIRVYNLIEAYRTYGHLLADINPIRTQPLVEPRELQLESFGLDKKDLNQDFPTYGILPEKTALLLKIIQALNEIYCKNIGVEYKYLCNPELEAWLQKRIEPNQFKLKLTIEQKQMILHDLNKSELFESFLHTKYVGQKRFSLEGGETLIPMLSALIDTAAQEGLKNLVIGMAHRGRLNVLSNILNKSYAEIFNEFDESYIPDSFEGSGDVKYHKGFSSEITTEHKKKVRIDLFPNPSHLESVNPLVEGQVFAFQRIINDESQDKIIPVLIHGDAAIAGQGIVYETLQLSKLEGYATGGTLHIVINNQIGFTTTPKEGRSTYYCTDIAKSFGAPVFHVNAEDPEACVYVTNLAVELRQKFHCDVFIDLNCYRKYGHNEADEPTFTQPLEYQLIRKKKPIREIYREELLHHSFLEKYMAEQMELEFKKSLQQALTDVKLIPRKEANGSKLALNGSKDEAFNEKVIGTSVSKPILQELAVRVCDIPPGFNAHPKLVHLMKERLSMLKEEADGKPIDWGMGETLAYASLLWEGIDIRISGQDSGRGTFSHRHAVLMDQTQEKAFYPLKNLKPDQGRFDIYNSPLSELAVLGFELGYSIGSPKALVIWEAQFGDFANGAQTIIDQYLVSGEQKWMQKSNLVLYLPHGYEGQGPDHSSGRMERFLQLTGDNNIRIVNPTTPAQLFHLLRRQVLDPVRKPLIVFTPKGLLRHPDCVNRLPDFTSGEFQWILEDPAKPKNVKKIVLCTGRIYYDLNTVRMKMHADDLAIIRLEQLYPLPKNKIKELLSKTKGCSEVIWAQEEPSNMGAWEYIRGELTPLIPKDIPLKYVGRNRSATTAVGSHAIHKKEHAEIMEAIFKDYEIRMPRESIEHKRI